MDTVTLATRLLLAAVFATAGLTKLADPAAARATFDGFGASRSLARLGAVALAPSELLVAAGLIFVPTARWAGVGAALLLLVFIAGIANALRHGRTPDCGCFGALRPTPIGSSTLIRNAALLALAVLVVVAGPGPAMDGWVGTRAATTVLITFAAVAVGLAALVYLPPIVDGARQPTAPNGAAPLAMGRQAPDFALVDNRGLRRTSDSLQATGLPLVIVFGSATCGSCLKLFPDLGRWQRSLAGRLQLAVVVGGDRDTAGSIADQHDLDEVLSDPEGDVSRAYGIAVNPCAISLTPEGRVASGPAAGPDAIEELLRLTLGRTAPIPTPWTNTTNSA